MHYQFTEMSIVNLNNKDNTDPIEFDLGTWSVIEGEDQYDYYLLGSIYSYVSSPDTVSTFFPRQVAVHYHDYNSSTNLFYDTSDLLIYNLDAEHSLGFCFSLKIDFEAACK